VVSLGRLMTQGEVFKGEGCPQDSQDDHDEEAKEHVCKWPLIRSRRGGVAWGKPGTDSQNPAAPDIGVSPPVCSVSNQILYLSFLGSGLQPWA